MKGWALAATVGTFAVLAVGLFMVMGWQVAMLSETNQLIHMLWALAAAAGVALYIRLLVKLLD